MPSAPSPPIATQALVARGPFSAGQWALEDVTLRALRDDELVVEIVASGLCHTDLHCGDTEVEKGVPGVYYPRVLGHEGAGYVRQVGSAVTAAQPGDPVFLSFSYCGSCHVCKTGPPSHCKNNFALNFIGEPVFISNGASDADIGGRFFGQSSLARHTIVSEASIVNAKDLGLSREELKLLAPLGCGLQTGGGTVVNVAKAGEEDAVAVVGMGGVGLAAVMAAKVQGCKTIIGLDRVEARLELAKTLGATHVINTSSIPLSEVVARVFAATDGIGASVSIDTSAHPPLVAAQIEYTAFMGKIIQVGTGMPDSNLAIHMQSFMVSGRQYFGAVQGHSRARDFMPQIVGWWRDGRFPIEKLVRFFDVAEFKEAAGAMGTAGVVKPVIVW
ncbi:uncharacterized protein K452DRAFT_73837 [Aplosporella prunicola CBS 121167]|uniref:Enoyl reductase (ER) domain-containing protein n=1 Tax=Aplosporella prunicola CBS 121167 TaxID=1176127 RepID=A0A6A6B9R9_9PEZI|nr:uncharacterized protein K452DRAFT_73837 [Aplosporella prunicola CBS 121167]KAF2139231.1 hypothetical protein K452DRAFT_73837 [Aplosporella prunicola CBS 121167]